MQQIQMRRLGCLSPLPYFSTICHLTASLVAAAMLSQCQLKKEKNGMDGDTFKAPNLLKSDRAFCFANLNTGFVYYTTMEIGNMSRMLFSMAVLLAIIKFHQNSLECC